MPIEALRTPDDRFAALPDCPWTPHYVETLPGYEGLRMAFIDEGPRNAPVWLCLHGEPSWSFLYRRMIPVFLKAGHRVVAPDFFGFGRSDKPVDDAVYGFHFHRNSLLRLIAHLDLQDVTLVVQDWGGLLGLTLPMALPDRIRRLLVMNTALATGEGVPSPGLESWRAFAAANPDLKVGQLMKLATPPLSDAEAGAYEAPFPSERYKAGVRRFPQMVMTEPGMEGADISREARDFLSTRWEGQSFMAIGMKDPVLGPDVMEALRAAIRGCPPAMQIADGGHFVQEWGEPIAEAAVKAFYG